MCSNLYHTEFIKQEMFPQTGSKKIKRTKHDNKSNQRREVRRRLDTRLRG